MPPAQTEQWFLDVVDLLTVEPAGGDDDRPAHPLGRLLNLQDRVAFVQMDDDSVAAVIWPSLQGPALQERLVELLELDKVTPLKLVIIGGDDGMRQILTDVQPGRLSRRMVQVFHLRDDGDVWGGRSSRLDGPTGRILAQVGAGKGPGTANRSLLEGRTVAPPEGDEAERVREHRAFIDRFRARRPVLTRALVGFIAVIFGLELLWGGSEFVVTLVRMGANTDGSLGPEPWRLLSSVSLHAGFLHVIVNGYVLYALGGFMERIVGWSRLAVLYVVAGLAGALASAGLSEALLSVGASGAIWGILGAAGALAYRPGTLLPRNLVKPMRRTALINLLINLSVSFLPQVDIMAHLGGGVAGAALVLSGVLTRGLSSPDPDRPEADEPESKTWTALAVSSLALLVASSVVAIVMGRPWVLVRAPDLTERALQPGLTVQIPDAISEPETLREKPDQRTWIFGDVLHDPIAVAVEIRGYEGDGLSKQDWSEAEQWFAELETEAPQGLERTGERRVIEDAPVPTFEERFVAPNGLRMKIRYVQFRWGRVIVETAYWSDAPTVWVDLVDDVGLTYDTD